MRFPLLLACLITIGGSSNTFAQGLEIGVKGGFSVYSGDFSPAEFGLYFDDMHFAGGAYLRYRPAARFGIRVDGNFGRLSADREIQAPNGEGDNLIINRNFQSQISEFGAALEYDLFYLGDYDNNYTAFYLYAGVSVLSFNPQGELNGELVDLQPLRTEGQGLDATNPNYALTPYELTKAVGTFGGGIRTRIGGRIVIGLELGTRFTGTDYLDDVSNTRVRYLDVVSGPGGSEAGFFSNPAVTNPGEVDPDFSYTRGGEYNDYYFVGSLTVGITIGEGGSGKTGCYNF